MTTHHTSGAADLPEAGCSKHHLIHCSQCRHDNMVRDLRAENDRLTTQLAALAAGQATAAQQAPAGESLRTDALCDLSYSHGLKAGWNYCASDDLAGFERAQKIGTEALRTIKSPTAQAAVSVQEDLLDAAFEAVRKRLCGVQRYSFVLDDDGLVRRVRDRAGNWIEFDEAHALLDPMVVDAARKQGGAT
ncbi:MAG: hypothetical protein ACD_23C00274G0004 [uncultured bacterium]|nr:MAG: hypothetical protein ACD_23C00274G0004 [uncultured bacterium]